MDLPYVRETDAVLGVPRGVYHDGQKKNDGKKWEQKKKYHRHKKEGNKSNRNKNQRKTKRAVLIS